ncbi:MAG: sulfatase-like hydrolase/transferase [Chloroflexi bacterium]|nr:sulfatase-like hydrolase/transferase [Chloroflexota bacterium]
MLRRPRAPVPATLWFRLLVGTCVVLAVTLGAVFLLVNKALTGSFQDYVEDQQSVRVQRAESIISRYYDRRREWTGVEGTIQSVADLMGERLVLADAQGRIIADSQNLLVGEQARDDWRGRRVSIRSQEFAVGTLYLSPTLVDQSALDPRASAFLNTFTSYLAWALLIGILAAVILSVGMARWLASPLEALTRAVRRMERGDLAQHINTTVGGEVGALAEAFNSLAASLARVEQLRQNMVTDIAHELRTPLTSIRGYLEAIQDGVVEPDEDTLATVHHELMQLTRLVDDLQELALAEAHQLQLQREDVDLKDVVAWEVRAFRPQAAAQQVELVLATSPDLPWLWIDAGRVRQVIGNLLRNALANTPAGGRIDVRVSTDDAHAIVSVSDTGVGIAPADLAHIFERFYRADKARSRRAGGPAGGTGLGLTIARELLRAHGGSISAYSVVGEGTTFTIQLPLDAEPDLTGPLPAPAVVAAPLEVQPSFPTVAVRGATIGALLGALAGLVESLLAYGVMRKPQGFLDLCGYAMLIDAAVFGFTGAALAVVTRVVVPLTGRRLRPFEAATVGATGSLVLIGLLIGVRWNQVFNRDASYDSPEALYPIAIITCLSLLLAVGGVLAASTIRQHWERGNVVLRTAPALLLAVALTTGAGLVGRDQLAHRLAEASDAPQTAAHKVKSPRSSTAAPLATATPETIAAASSVTPLDPPSNPSADPPAAPPAQVPAEVPTRPPNVLLITVSGLRADHLGAYGYEKARTPTIDELARRGIRFTNAMTAQPDRNPAHAAILSGTYPGTNGVRHDLVDRLAPESPSLAAALADRGYQTAAIYSWVSFEPAYSGLDRGFHDYLDLTINRPDYLSDNRAQILAATYERLKAYLALPGAMGDPFSLSSLDEAIDGRADVTTEAAIAWTEQHQDVPFFLWVQYQDPSPPYAPPAPFDDVEDTACGDACPDGSVKTLHELDEGAQMSAAQINHLVALYDGEIAFTDQQIGRLLVRLTQLGLTDNTLIVLTSDQGQSFAEHGSWLAGDNLHSASTHVPLIVSMPSRLATRIVAVPTTSVDVAPTILDALGLSVPDVFDGQSLLPIVLGHSDGDDRLAFSELADQSEVAVSDTYWKLIWSDADQLAHLYFLGDDPNELNDRLDAEPEVAARLLSELQEWRSRQGD